MVSEYNETSQIMIQRVLVVVNFDFIGLVSQVKGYGSLLYDWKDVSYLFVNVKYSS